MIFTNRVRSIFALGLLLAAGVCHAQNAPNAGGYAGEFGSDYGVGRIQIKSVREAVAVVGFAARDKANRTLPWLGLRFAQDLEDQLRAPMRKSADTGGIARFLSSQGTRFWDASAWQFTNGSAPRGALLLANGPSYRSAFPLWISGEVMLGQTVAPGANASPDSALQIRVRAWRWENGNFRAASPIIALAAPLSEWPQLAPRTALALLDALRVPISEDERTGFLRDASPLQPSATAARLAAEMRLGTMQADALECRILGRAGAKSIELEQSKRRGEAARRALTSLLKLSPANTISDGDAFRRIHQNAQDWKPYVLAVSRKAKSR